MDLGRKETKEHGHFQQKRPFLAILLRDGRQTDFLWTDRIHHGQQRPGVEAFRNVSLYVVQKRPKLEVRNRRQRLGTVRKLQNHRNRQNHH